MQCAQCDHTMFQCAQKCPKVHKRLQRCTLWRLRVSGMVRRPYHGPRVDVEELVPSARPVAVIAHSPGIVRRLLLVPVIRDRPVRAVGDQGQSAQDVMDRDNVDGLSQNVHFGALFVHRGFEHVQTCTLVNTDMMDRFQVNIGQIIRGQSVCQWRSGRINLFASE
jgi:hypothetical protein